MKLRWRVAISVACWSAPLVFCQVSAVRCRWDLVDVLVSGALWSAPVGLLSTPKAGCWLGGLAQVMFALWCFGQVFCWGCLGVHWPAAGQLQDGRRVRVELWGGLPSTDGPDYRYLLERDIAPSLVVRTWLDAPDELLPEIVVDGERVVLHRRHR